MIKYLTDGARHLICLPYSIENLHDMALDLGIKRCWFHKDHYDIPKRRIAEIEAKCTIVSSKEIVSICRKNSIRGEDFPCTNCGTIYLRSAYSALCDAIMDHKPVCSYECNKALGQVE